MATVITTIQGTDPISGSRTDINNNFSSLNTNKIETSVIDTDNTFSANSDTRIPSQKATKTYVDTGGNVNASEIAKGIVQEATDAQVIAGTATGSTGSKLFVTPAKLATRLTTVLAPYALVAIFKNGTTTKNISDASTTQTIAHGLGKIPKKIKLKCSFTSGAGATRLSSEANVVYNGTTQSSNSFYASGSSNYVWDNTFSLNEYQAVGVTPTTGVVTFDATNISIAWTKGTSVLSSTYQILWEAEA